MFAYVSLLALVAAAVAIPAPDQFYSAKMEEPKPADYYYEDRLTEHTFITQLDHFRPQDSRTVEFVSFVNTAHGNHVISTQWLNFRNHSADVHAKHRVLRLQRSDLHLRR